jgi:hypothetical protein
MQSHAELMRLLADWRELTHFESDAILRDDWNGLADHQARKAQLQEEITGVLAPSALAGREHRSIVEQHGLERMVRELVALETANHDRLAARRLNRSPELQRLGRTARDLQCMRRAYGPGRDPYWQSYS